VRDVRVTCAVNRYSIGGTVSGLEGGSVVLQNNGGDPVEVAANGAFTFRTQIASGGAYDVTVRTQPSNPRHSCAVANGAGTVGAAAVTNITVTCTRIFTVSVTVSGLEGSGLLLRNNGGDDLAIPSNGSWTFATPLASGAAFAVTVATHPLGPSQTCVVANGSGTIGNSDVANVTVTCTTNSFTIGGVVSAAPTFPVLLLNNGGDAISVPNGPFTFPTLLLSGATYNVTASAPLQTCTVTNGAGIVGGGNVTDIVVTCQ
jgi:hypothetical protein